MEEKLESLISESQRILITTHISPDPDAVSSALLLSETLKANFPKKRIKVVIEEKPDGLDFLGGYEKITFNPLFEELQKDNPELLIVVDANSYERVSRQDGIAIRKFVHSRKNKLKTVIIDHHQPHDKDDSDVYINQGYLAAAQSVYNVCFKKLKMRKPEGWAETTMTGLYADTGGFVYHDEHYRETFKLAGELVTGGADIESIRNRLNHYTKDGVKVLGEFAKNISSNKDYSFSFLSDNFVGGWTTQKKDIASLHKGSRVFVDDFIRNIDGRQWGFIVYKDVPGGEDSYHISLRSFNGVRDVSKIAFRFGGGGHKPAAGARFRAASLDEALEKVHKAIEEAL